MKIKKKFLRKHEVCQSGYEWFLKQGNHDHEYIINKLVDKDHLEWANWLIVHLMKRKQCIRYAVFAAEQVIDNFESAFPDDDRPRAAIEAAKVCIKSNTKKNRSKARSAARSAASARSVSSAAVSSEALAFSAAWVAASAASAAYSAAMVTSVTWSASAASSAAKSMPPRPCKMKVKIIKYGLKLLGKTKGI